MMTRQDACRILGVEPGATKAEIKKAYKSLVKLFHPDAGTREDAETYLKIGEAYEFLMGEPEAVMPTAKTASGPQTAPVTKTPTRAARVFGGESVRRTGTNRADFEKKIARQKEEKAASFAREMEEYQRKQDEYNKAMEAIEAIRVAEAIKALLKAREDGTE